LDTRAPEGCGTTLSELGPTKDGVVTIRSHRNRICAPIPTGIIDLGVLLACSSTGWNSNELEIRDRIRVVVHFVGALPSNRFARDGRVAFGPGKSNRVLCLSLGLQQEEPPKQSDGDKRPLAAIHVTLLCDVDPVEMGIAPNDVYRLLQLTITLIFFFSCQEKNKSYLFSSPLFFLWIEKVTFRIAIPSTTDFR
jgi:hypothetical protein